MTDRGHLTRACWQPWESLNIAADGKVYPCCVISPSLVVGDLSTQPVEEIVAGAAMLTLKKRLLTGEISELPCQACPNAPLAAPEEFRQSLRERYLPAPATATPSQASTGTIAEETNKKAAPRARKLSPMKRLKRLIPWVGRQSRA